LAGTIVGATAVGAFVGRRVRHRADGLSEPFGALQAALLGLVALLLAFGLSLALSRYEDRRASIVTEANAIGTTWLRAQTLPEPIRSRSLGLLVRYTESAIDVADYRPGSDAELAAVSQEDGLQRRLWALAGQAMAAAPQANAPRLYMETLNEMIDMQTVRVAILNNRVPTGVLLLEIFGAALAVGLLAAYLVLSGRGILTVSVASILVVLVLFVIADLDRPTRGEIQVPDTVLVEQLESMQEPPAAAAPRGANAAPGRP
jgi:hypothetical protein